MPKKSSQEEEAIGKSRGGLSTKIHAAVGALGNLVRLILTAGQESEYTQAECLIQGFDADYVLAHRGYDSDLFVEMIHTAGATAVIPGIASNNAITTRKSTKSESGRTHLPETQAVSTDCHSLRKTQTELPIHAESGLFNDLVDLIVNAP